MDYDTLKRIAGTPEFADAIRFEMMAVDATFMALLRQYEAAYPGCQQCSAAELRGYATLNYLAVLKIIKKHDKFVRRTGHGPEIAAEVEAELFNTGFCITLLSSSLFLAESERDDDFPLGIMWEKRHRREKRLDTIYDDDFGNTKEGDAEPIVCPVCIEAILDAAVLPCAHQFCWACLANAAAHGINACPLCRKERSLTPVDVTVDTILGVLARHYYPSNRRVHTTFDWDEVQYELAPETTGSTKRRLKTPPQSPSSLAIN